MSSLNNNCHEETSIGQAFVQLLDCDDSNSGSHYASTISLFLIFVGFCTFVLFFRIATRFFKVLAERNPAASIPLL